jgi:hypothetical protein
MDDRHLVSWAFGMFHAAFLLALGIALLHWTGGVGTSLAALSTGLGVAVFALLAGLAWLGAARTLEGVDVRATRADGIGPLTGRAALWAGVAGAAVVATVLAAFAFASGQLEGLLFAALAAPFAFAGGAVVGLVLAALDLMLTRMVLAMEGRVGGEASGPPADQTFMTPPRV